MFNRNTCSGYGAWICEIKTSHKDDFIQNQINELFTNYNKRMIELNSKNIGGVYPTHSGVLLSTITDQWEKIVELNKANGEILGAEFKSIPHNPGLYWGYSECLKMMNDPDKGEAHIQLLAKKSNRWAYLAWLCRLKRLLQCITAGQAAPVGDTETERMFTWEFNHYGEKHGFEASFTYIGELIRDSYVSVNGNKMPIAQEEKKRCTIL